MNQNLLPTIGVVVPALAAGGGVPAVASFLCRSIESSGRFQLRVFSLATSSRDRDSVLMRSPRTWLRAPGSSSGTWEGRKFTHFGASLAELEFMRYQPRPALTAALRQCDLIQVVAGQPAHALVAQHSGRPVALQVATLAKAERGGAQRAGNPALRLWRRGMTRLATRFDAEGLRSVNAVLVENRWMREHVERAVHNHRTSVSMAYPGVDCTFYTPLPDRNGPVRDEPYILYVGRLQDPRKNLGLLVRAYVRLCALTRKPPRLVLAGHGQLPAAVRADLAFLSDPGLVSVVSAPDAEALRALYRHAACFALSSHEEGFGMVLVEAMACGVPVIATRCGGPEEIITDGIDGRLVGCGAREAMALAMLEVCADFERNLRMGEAARATVLRRFSSQSAFEPFLDVYQRLLG
ncbi:MAG TPA: glycosyltransferase family 4 protein [Dyella sp.]|uniref:glycosyltransferase family 4 protein n=1 Tax=Dyella sp. TaxID=1869338 RepID=UPI002D76F4D6|nr:glycosyltransferase family 4 protein [Dyella sp.]HET6553595.1 glycosyltransferase family 4 protein [Dyella sp.]